MVNIISRLSDGEEIAVIQIDAIGGRKIIANKALITFFDELIDSLPSDVSQKDSAVVAIISAIKASLQDVEFELQETEANINGKMDNILSKVNAIPNLAFFSDLERRVNNLEQLV